MTQALAGRKSILIASHNNPDPDAITSALLLQCLLKRQFKVSSIVTYSGVIGRAENNKLLEYAGADIRRLEDIDVKRYGGVALVDTQPGTGNHRFGEADDVVLVFDHHRRRLQTTAVPFHDVRTHLGATTTLLYLYWMAAGIPVSKRYATMMLYALSSETADMGREASTLDREVYKTLYASSDLRALSSIINAKVDRAYFQVLHRGLERSKIHGPVVVTRLGRMPYPDVAAQIAENFLRLTDAEYTIALGVYRGALLFSMRAENPEAHLGRLARRVVTNFGSAGGHGSAAGGQIEVRGKAPDEIEKVQETIVKRFLDELGQGGKRCRSMI